MKNYNDSVPEITTDTYERLGNAWPFITYKGQEFFHLALMARKNNK